MFNSVPNEEIKGKENNDCIKYTLHIQKHTEHIDEFIWYFVTSVNASYKWQQIPPAVRFVLMIHGKKQIDKKRKQKE